MEEDLKVTARTKVRRLPDRGTYARSVVEEIIDEANVAHVGFVVEGQPRVLPMTYGRDGDRLFLHGAVGNAMLRAAAGVEVCVTITLLDGLVLARSAFHHSMNYRSVVLLGRAELVTAEDEKLRAFDVIVEHAMEGRSQQVRPASAKELRATTVLAMPIVEASAKVRSGGVKDDVEDMDAQVWAGVVPLALTAGEPLQDEDQIERIGSLQLLGNLGRGAV